MSMKVVVTGANGFIGRNLVSQFLERGREVIPITRDSTDEDLAKALSEADVVCHLAGVNRPDNEDGFYSGNVEPTRALCDLLGRSPRPLRILFASSLHAGNASPYGRSKRQAEQLLEAYGRTSAAAVHIFRLPHVVGKWCRPNYNSVVATFCHNITRGLPIRVDNPDSKLEILHVDDLAVYFDNVMTGAKPAPLFPEAGPIYSTTVGSVAEQLFSFRDSRESLVTERVGDGLIRVLYATYLSYIPVENCRYPVRSHEDHRGVFVEMLKTRDSGQFSYFTAHPGVTRGGHYHHSKSEKFLVVRGTARFRFQHVITGERHEVSTSGDCPEVVETLPGWAHDICNTGTEELVVLLWANEAFDRERPDTIAREL